MYLKGSKFNMNKQAKRSSPLRILILVVLVGAAIYFNEKIVPTIPPPFIPTNTPTRSPESYIADAQQQEAQGKYTQAIETYGNAIQVDPKNSSNYISLARLQIYSGKYEDAIKSAENALLLSENNAQAYALRGWAMGLNGDYLNSQSSLQKSIDLDPNNGSAYAYMAEVLIYVKQAGQDTLTTLDTAISDSKKALSLAPDTMESHRARGLVLEETGNPQEAQKEYEAAIAINPNIADLHLFLGRIFRAQGDNVNAIQEFNKAVPLDPTNPLPKTYIARTYANIGEFPRAVQYAQQALNDSPHDPYMYGNLGVMLYKNHQYSESVKNLKIAVSGGAAPDGQAVQGLKLDYGTPAQYYYTYGLALANLGECTTALQISTLLLQTVHDDDISTFNAQEIINICQQVAANGTKITPTPTLEGTAGPTSTPSGTPVP
jgi:tetratricopeptide (TPR) repeat protein